MGVDYYFNPPPVDREVRVRIKRLTPTAQVPKYQTAGAAGLDLHADGLDGLLQLAPGDTKLVQTGISLAIPAGFEGQIRSRSGLSLKQGLISLNAPGTIDSDYRGPIGIILHNVGPNYQTVKQGDRIAQLVICPVVQAALIEVEELDETVRGDGGFGSTKV